MYLTLLLQIEGGLTGVINTVAHNGGGGADGIDTVTAIE